MTEIRYRRLLALYPTDFRREYEEEMLGVLMADSRPGPGQVFDLVRGALAARLRQPFAARAEWRRAARVVQLFGAILMLAVSARRVVGAAIYPGETGFHVDQITMVRLIGWLMVAIAAFAGARWLGLAGAITGLAGEIANPAQYYADLPASMLYSFWMIMAAVVVLIAGLVADRGPRPRGWPLVAVAGAGIVASYPLMIFSSWVMVSDSLSMRYQAIPLLLVAVAGLGALRQEAAVRRRVFALSVPVLVTVPLVRVGFEGFIRHNQGHPESLQMLGPLHFAALVLIPAAAFLAVAELNRRFELSRAGQVRTHE
ncbi:MAG: hypothetical protein ABW022_16340 [Actinoplanes sp.]